MKKLSLVFWHFLHRLVNWVAWHTIGGSRRHEGEKLHWLWRLNDFAAYKYLPKPEEMKAIVEKIAADLGLACQYNEQGALVGLVHYEADETTQVDVEEDTQPNLKIP